MTSVSVTEIKNRLSAFLDRVRAGETIVITDRGVPVARIEPVARTPDPTGRRLRLERAGIIRVGSAKPPISAIRKPGPTLAGGASAVESLIEERRSGR